MMTSAAFTWLTEFNKEVEDDDSYQPTPLDAHITAYHKNKMHEKYKIALKKYHGDEEYERPFIYTSKVKSELRPKIKDSDIGIWDYGTGP